MVSETNTAGAGLTQGGEIGRHHNFSLREAKGKAEELFENRAWLC
jgi:hypothetical protein